MISLTTHTTIQELAALDATAQAAAHELLSVVSLLSSERAGVQSRLDMVQLDSDFVAAAGARERLRRLDEAIQEQTTRRDAAVAHAAETVGDLAVAQNELDRAETWLVQLRVATSAYTEMLTIRGWRFELARCQEVIARRSGQLVELPSVPPEADGTEWQETAGSTPLALSELVS